MRDIACIISEEYPIVNNILCYKLITKHNILCVMLPSYRNFKNKGFQKFGKPGHLGAFRGLQAGKYDRIPVRKGLQK